MTQRARPRWSSKARQPAAPRRRVRAPLTARCWRARRLTAWCCLWMTPLASTWMRDSSTPSKSCGSCLCAGCAVRDYEEEFFSTFLSEESSKPRKSEWQLPSPGVLQEAATAPAIRLKRRLLLGTFVRVTRSPSRPPARRLCTDPASVCTQISCLTRTLRSRSSHARTHPPTHTHHPRMHSRLPHYLSH